MENVLFLAVPIIYILFTIYFANINHAKDEYEQQTVRLLLYGAPFLMSLGGMMILTYAMMVSALPAEMTEAELLEVGFTQRPNISVVLLIITLLVSACGTFLSIQIIQSHAIREKIRNLLPASSKFNPDSHIHMTALVFTILISVLTLSYLFMLESAVESEPPDFDATETLLQSVIQIVAAVLGIGFAIRRQLPQALARLGLTIPTWKDLGRAVIVVILAFVWIIVVGGIASLFFTAEQLAEMNQSSDALIEVLSGSLFLIVFISINAAISEELLFRGALQPVLGNVLTSIFFTVLHTQVLLSPGIIAIFGVSMIFGVVRQRYNTTTAIIAHFLYDFIVLSLASAGV